MIAPEKSGRTVIEKLGTGWCRGKMPSQVSQAFAGDRFGIGRIVEHFATRYVLCLFDMLE